MTITADRRPTKEAAPTTQLHSSRSHRAAAREHSGATECETMEEHRFRTIAEASPLGMAILTADCLLYMNPAGLRHFGAESLDELAGHSIWDFVHPDERDMARERLASAAEGRLYGRAVVRCVRVDGCEMTVEVEGWPMRFGGANAIRLTFDDITRRQIAEEALRDSEERFRLAFDRAPTGVALMAVDGTILRVNKAIREMTDFTEEELVGRRFQDLTHPDDLGANTSLVDELLSGRRESYEMVKRYVRRDGSALWARVHCSLVSDDRGEPLHMVGHVEDITTARSMGEARREVEERFRRVWHISAEGLRLTDMDGIILSVNDAYCRIVGKSEEELVGQSIACVYGDTERAQEYIASSIKTCSVQPFMDYRIQLWDGRVRWFETSNVYVDSDEGPPMMLSGFRDVTERKRTQAALERYRLLAEHSNDIMLFVRPDGTILEANRAAERAYGYAHTELQAMSMDDLVDAVDNRGAVRGLTLPAVAGTGSLFPARHRRKSGRPFPVEMSVQSAAIGDEDVLLMIIRDTTERLSLERQLRHQASHDPLTKLPNRLLFMDRLEQALLRRGGRATVLFLDLDRFKNINDSLGHSAGDQLLTAVAGRLKSCIRASDTAARLGGDEFTVLLDGCDGTGEATRTAKRILRKLQAPFEVHGQEVFVSASIGVAVGDGKKTTAEEILREADLAMYQAKTSGKARHAVFVRKREEDMRGRLQLETDLRRAIDRGEFQVYYQPVVLMETRRTIAVEALTRWHHPRFGLMPPDEFVPLQEQIGMIEPFTMWVLNEAQRQCLELQRQGLKVSVAVNLSPYNLHEADFAARVREMLRESGLVPSSLKLEITENAIMTNPERALHILGQLNDMGVRLSVDDFGTGYSSLTYLKQLPVHEIKIDKSFVIGMDANDEDDAAIVRATIDLAHNLRKKVVAEGVESADVWNLLNVLGCDAAQGFHMSPPLPALDLVPWLKASPFGLGNLK